MRAQKILPEERAVLIRLIDDATPSVRDALIREFRILGDAGTAFLRELIEGKDKLLSTHAQKLMNQLGNGDTKGQFLQFIRSFNYELEKGIMLMERTIFPSVTLRACQDFLDQVARRCQELIVLPSAPWERCKVLNHVLFNEYGFTGDSEHFVDPLNSFLDQVIKRRRGIPITLSIIYLLVARRISLNLEPIGLPGRFMVGCFLEQEPFYIDPFDRGVFRSSSELVQMMIQNNLVLDERCLMPASIGEVLCRCCRNLVNHYAAMNDIAHSKMFAEFVYEFESTYRRYV